MTTGRRVEYHVYLRRVDRTYRVVSDAESVELYKLAWARYRPVAVGFGTRAEAERYIDRLVAGAGGPPRPAARTFRRGRREAVARRRRNGRRPATGDREEERAVVAAVAELAAARGWTTKRGVAGRVGRPYFRVAVDVDRLAAAGVLAVDYSRTPHRVAPARIPSRPMGERK